MEGSGFVIHERDATPLTRSLGAESTWSRGRAPGRCERTGQFLGSEQGLFDHSVLAWKSSLSQYSDMNLPELLPILHDLPRADKFRAVQFLTAELAQSEANGIGDGMTFPIWSPHDAVDAAETLTRYLNEKAGTE